MVWEFRVYFVYMIPYIYVRRFDCCTKLNNYQMANHVWPLSCCVYTYSSVRYGYGLKAFLWSSLMAVPLRYLQKTTQTG